MIKLDSSPVVEDENRVSHDQTRVSKQSRLSGDAFQEAPTGAGRASIDLDVLVEEYYERIYRAAMALAGNPADAADLTQETFSQACRFPDRFEGRSRMYTYLYGILLNIDRRRRRTLGMSRKHTQRIWENSQHREPSVAPSASAVAENRELSHTLWSLVDRMDNQDHAETLRLRFQKGLKYEEIAAATDTPLGTVKSRIFHGLNALREMLHEAGDMGGNSEGVASVRSPKKSGAMQALADPMEGQPPPIAREKASVTSSHTADEAYSSSSRDLNPPVPARHIISLPPDLAPPLSITDRARAVKENLWALLDHVPQHRAILDLRFRMALELEEIAEELGITTRTAIRRINAALKALEKIVIDSNEARTLREHILSLIDQVPDAQDREILHLRFCMRLTWKKIAEEINISVSAVRHRTSRAVKSLRDVVYVDSIRQNDGKFAPDDLHLAEHVMAALRYERALARLHPLADDDAKAA